MTRKYRWLKVMLGSAALAISVVACSGGSDEASSAAAQEQAAKARRAAQRAKPADPLAGMIKAVTASKGNLPLEVRFQLVSRPEAGKPVDIKLAFVPAADLHAISAVIKPANGLQISSDAQTRFEGTKAGEIKEYTFTATAPNSGIFVATIEVTVTRETGDNAYVYSIPIPVPSPASAAASSAVTGMSAGAG
jgi:hypothetical protein